MQKGKKRLGRSELFGKLIIVKEENTSCENLKADPKDN
jgi:hypothetical protein